ncbi:MAG: YdcF family protein [Proteobacteria bacterium]|nr:YdcF family protein [Pseudomonadota bacterium]
MTIKTLLRTLLLPPAGPLLLGIVGLYLRRSAAARGQRAGGWLITSCVALLWLLSTPWLADLLGHVSQRVPPLDLRHLPDAQAIVVLGGGVVELNAPEYGGAPVAGMGSLERLAYAAWLARRTALPVAISGAPKEAIAMRASLQREFGVQVRWVENRSRDTFENARNSAQLLLPQGVARILLVTDADHEWRAMHEFRSAGFTVTPAPARLWPWQGEEIGVRRYLPGARALNRSSEALYEILGDLARQVMAALHLRRQES